MTPDPNNLSLGAGEVMFDRFDADGNSTGYRHLGNVETLSIATTVEKLSKKSSMTGKRSILKEVVVGQSAAVTLVLSEFDKENLALAFRGDTADFTQTGAWSLTDQSLNGGSAIAFDRWYDMGKKQLLSVVIKQASTTLTLGTDYELNAELGLVKILSSGTGTEAVTTWNGSAQPLASSKVRGLASSSIVGALKYFSAVDQVSGPRYELDVHKVELAPDGDLGLISEAFGTFTLKGTAQEDSTQAVGEEFFTLRELTAAESGS